MKWTIHTQHKLLTMVISASLGLMGTMTGQTVLGESIGEFSGVQGQDDWSYGYRNYTADGGGDDYDATADFIEFTAGQFDMANNKWDLGGGAPWTEVGQTGVHPNGLNNTFEHWAIRRWTASATDAPTPTLVSVEWNARKANTANTGVTGQLHHNGQLIKAVLIPGNDTTGVTSLNFLTINAGDHIDLALTAVGVGDRNDGNDGSHTNMTISTVVDSDGDLLADIWEETFFPGDLTQLSSGNDFDGDSVNDEDEFANGTDPTLKDTDGDGLEDGWEKGDGIYVGPMETGSNPLLIDTDGDGLDDGDEVNGSPATNPNLADTDGDTFSDSEELIYGTDPNDINETPLTDALADSRTGFSGVDGQDGWRWGYRDYNATGETTDYDAGADFTPFPVDGTTTRSSVNFWNGTAYDWANDAGNVNPPWTAMGRESTHPNDFDDGENEHWTIRRWTASGLGATTPVRVVWHTRKGNTAGTGVTGSIHLNGAEVDTRTIAGNDGTGFVHYYYINLNDGDIVDLVLTPEGTDRDDGADGSNNWMTIDTRVPAIPIQPNGKYFIPVDAADSDSDGLADFWEEVYFPGDLTQLATGNDNDGDGLMDEGEQAAGTDPTVADSDGDGLDDGDEAAHGADPCKSDTDGDGYTDGFEVARSSDPADADSLPVLNPIIWDFPENITGNLSDINTDGTLVAAYSGSDDTVTVGGISFGPGLHLDNVFGAFDPWNRGNDADYETLLDSGTWSGGDELVELTGLTDGQQYLVQVWVADTRAGTEGRIRTYATDLTLNDPDQVADLDSGFFGDEANFPGQYVTGTFTASGTSQYIYMTSFGPGAQYNALQLRQLAPPASGVTITSCGFNGAAFDVTASGLDTTKTYVLKRSTDLQSFATTVGVPFTPASATETVSDPAPPTGTAFYRIEEQ